MTKRFWLYKALARRGPLDYLFIDLTMARAAVADWGGWPPLPLDSVWVDAEELEDDD